MKRDELVRSTAPDALVDYLRQTEPPMRAPHDHHGDGDDGSAESVREATYRGHHIVIRTRYRIEVDGVPVEGHLGVTNDGRVHYHAVPNLGFSSAVDLVKQLIDTFPEDFQARYEGHSHREEP